MHSPTPLTRDLVLIGGGHTHALVLRKWGMRPLPGVRLTVINPGPTAPYSGMLPGHIAGHYSLEQLEIDLVRLGRFAGARVILDRATGIDRAAHLVHLEGRAPIAYDIASLDIGITARMDGLPGFAEHAVPVKPLDDYAARWRSFRAAVATEQAKPCIAVIGGGVAGVELSLAMSHALRRDGATPQITVIEATGAITGVPAATGRRLMRALTDHGVGLITGQRAARVDADGVTLQDGRRIDAALVVGSAGAWPHQWIRDSDLPQSDGFVPVTPELHVAGDPALFAVGDCAHLAHAPRPKAGVFAVRAAPVLFHNLRAVLSGGTLRPFHPQMDYLKLISLGGQSALAEKFGIALSGPLLWQWKNRIDTRFMTSLERLPAMPAPKRPDLLADGVADILDARPLCGGCGAKVGGDVLKQALLRLELPVRADVLTGPGDDAAVLAVGDVRQVITTDHLRAFTLDPALMARIAALHALGDVWAMGAMPQAALAQIVLPQMSPAMQARTLDEIMGAANAVFAAEGAAIVGGHTSIGAELTIGFTVTGLLDRPAITVAGARAGDALILTRRLGSGVMLAAEMQRAAAGRHVAAALAEMARPQGAEAAILRGTAHAMTDVTGFGLAGHLMAICAASGVAAVLDLAAVPVYPGALELVAAGHASTLFQANRDAAPVFGPDSPHARLLHDPQTAGGFLAAVAADQAGNLMARLRATGAEAAIIGALTDGPPAISLR